MSDERERRGAGFWAAVALVAVLVYPLSFGPACWIASWVEADETMIVNFYQPVLRMALSGPGWLKRAALWYSAVGVGARNGSSIFRDPNTGRCRWTYGVP